MLQLENECQGQGIHSYVQDPQNRRPMDRPKAYGSISTVPRLAPFNFASVSISIQRASTFTNQSLPSCTSSPSCPASPQEGSSLSLLPASAPPVFSSKNSV